MQFYHYPRGSPPSPPTNFWHPPLGTQIHSKSQLCPQCAQRCARERPKTQKSGPLGAQGCQKVLKWSQNGGKWGPKMCKKSMFRKKMPNVVWTHYLLYILTTGTLQKPHFLTPPSNPNAGLFRVVPRMPPRGCKMAPTGPKNGESGVPRDPQGCQRVPQCPPKMLQKIIENQHPSPGLPPGVLLGCLGYPNAPKYVYF